MPQPETQPPRVHLLASVLLSFTAHLFHTRPMRPACSVGLAKLCLAAGDGHLCVHCALAEARVIYRRLDPRATEADMAAAAALAADDAHRWDLHTIDTRPGNEPAPFNLPGMMLNRAAADQLHAAIA